MKVALVTGSLSRSGGGVAAAVQCLSRSLSIAKANVHVVGLRDEGWAADAEQWTGIEASPLPVVGPFAIGYAPKARQCLLSANADIVHTHGIWKYSSGVVARWGASTGRPYVVSPHGMLDGWALKNSAWKKRIAARLYENAHLRGASCFHALCEAEAHAVRELGFRHPICVIPNGIATPQHAKPTPAPWAAWVPHEHRVMLFLGRLHPKKNLRELIKAWPAESVSPDWHLAIAGWDEGGHEQTLQKLVRKLGLSKRIHFLGPLFGREKEAAFRAADAFVLPSFSEGLPIAVLEAWSYGLPVLMTDACNLTQGFSESAAFRLSLDGDRMNAELLAFMRMEREAQVEMGRNGQRLTGRDFCWSRVAEQLLQVYRWLLNGGAQPACILS
ncbi:glycosyltransferase [Hyphomicrobium sp.]|uniref:glycosyltransferase n=1 Tax=Hyphomicrobium sp. TaxID=82 RepID=UPI002D781171|nr:glycosyltransferase [Hyphomicrobium sp.]HET6389274.1 glycosyltransferase [Hyphomicrobium sp.]